MGRAKVPLELITNKKKRDITLQRRKSGIMKKARELRTLCDVNVCMIICADDQEPHIFPENPNEFSSLIDHYKKNQRSGSAGKAKTYGLSEFLKDRNIKIEQELEKAKKKNVEAKYPSWFDFLNDFSEGRLREFASGLDRKIDLVKNQVESLKTVNLDRYSFYPGDFLDLPWLDPNPNPNPNTSLNPDPMMMMPSDSGNVYSDLSFGPCVPMFDEPNNVNVIASNPNSGTGMMVNEDNYCYDYDNLSMDPLPPLMHTQPCSMPAFPSQVHGPQVTAYGTRSDGVIYYK